MGEQDLAGMRVAYDAGVLERDGLAPTWYEQLEAWLAEAQEAGVAEANAMVLATVGDDNHPSSRTVLCKGIDERGVVFYTNFTSAKSRALRTSRYASATFPWYPIQRQAHVRGPVEMVGQAEALEYWVSRPRGSQLGAWASAQSATVRDRRVLDDALATITARFEGQDVPLPPHWGGWRIVPDEVEFWQGRADRMHDRLRFVVDRSSREWSVRRLAP